MGQKVNPIGLRLGINKSWDSKWFADKHYGDWLIEDIRVRKYIHDSLAQAAISKIVIERRAKNKVVTIHAGRPGVVIGKKGSDIEKLRLSLDKKLGGDVSLNIVEVRKPALEAQLVASNIAQQIERRVGHRRAMKRAIQEIMRGGVGGVRILVSGRLGGAEIARSEDYREGRVPLHTLRADIDYGTAEAHTSYGVCGVKVWICKN